jgi:hypothetical protein
VALSAAARLRAALQPQSQPLVLRHTPASARCPDRRLRRPEGARGRTQTLRDRAARRRAGRLRQGLRGRDFE